MGGNGLHDANTPNNDKLDSSSLIEKSVNSLARPYDGAAELANFLAQRILPDFRRFNIENDKVSATCANIMYYNISPAFRTRTR